MASFKRTPPNKPKPETCEVPDCEKEPTCVLGGYWFCAEHGNRDYEKTNVGELMMSTRESLANRLLEHAECHEYIADNSEEQKQWMDDLREAARLITVGVHETTRSKGSAEECYEAFCEFHPDGKDLYPAYSDWLFSKDEKAVSFRQGWAAANKNQRTERS